MKEFLDFGTYIDAYGEPYEYICEKEVFFPACHKFLIDFSSENTRKELDKLINKINSYIKEPVSYKELISGIKKLHPYFSVGNNAEACFNRTIADALIEKDPDMSVSTKRTFESLMCRESFTCHDIEDWTGISCSLNDILECSTFASLRINLIFDDSKKNLSKLPVSTRVSLYNSVSCSYPGGSILDIPVRFEASGDVLNKVECDFSFTDEYNSYVNELLSPEGRELDIPDFLFERLSKYGETEAVSYISYKITSLTKLIELETYLMLRDGIRMDRCKRCRKLFVVEEAGQEFCDYEGKDGESCLSHAKYIELKEMLSSFYKTSYKKHFKRVASRSEDQDTFDRWKAEMQELKKKILNKEILYSINEGNPFV